MLPKGALSRAVHIVENPYSQDLLLEREFSTLDRDYEKVGQGINQQHYSAH